MTYRFLYQLSYILGLCFLVCCYYRYRFYRPYRAALSLFERLVVKGVSHARDWNGEPRDSEREAAPSSPYGRGCYHFPHYIINIICLLAVVSLFFHHNRRGPKERPRRKSEWSERCEGVPSLLLRNERWSAYITLYLCFNYFLILQLPSAPRHGLRHLPRTNDNW